MWYNFRVCMSSIRTPHTCRPQKTVFFYFWIILYYYIILLLFFNLKLNKMLKKIKIYIYIYIYNRKKKWGTQWAHTTMIPTFPHVLREERRGAKGGSGEKTKGGKPKQKKK